MKSSPVVIHHGGACGVPCARSRNRVIVAFVCLSCYSVDTLRTVLRECAGPGEQQPTDELAPTRIRGPFGVGLSTDRRRACADRPIADGTSAAATPTPRVRAVGIVPPAGLCDVAGRVGDHAVARSTDRRRRIKTPRHAIGTSRRHRLRHRSP